jgi:1-acyl-sn-glycerol-3-phosphate acyltransferase
MIRLLAVATVIIPATVWGTLRILWAMARRSPRLPCVCERVQRSWSGLLLKVSGVKVVLENEDVIARDLPQVLVVNHTSWFDVLALSAYLPGSYRFVAKKEIERVPLFGPSLRRCGHIYIDRHDRARAFESLEQARETLEKAAPTIIMFPEGTRSASGELQRFKKGAFVLALQTGADVVPGAISGSRDVMPKGSLRIRPGTVRVRFGEPIRVGSMQVDQRDELTRKAWEAVAALQAAPPGGSAPSDSSPPGGPSAPDPS